MNSKLRLIVVATLVLFGFSLKAQAEIITLVNGSTLEGKIIERDDDYIKVRFTNGALATYYEEEIELIEDDIQEAIEELVDETVIIEEVESKNLDAYVNEKNLSYTSGNHFIWEVTSPTVTNYILGSMHLANNSFYPLPSIMEESFKKSDVLVVEADILSVNQLEVMMLVQANGMYMDGSKLSDHVSLSTMRMLKKFLKKVNADFTMMSVMKPWLVVVTVTELELKRLGLNPELGIDMHFLKKARGTKNIVQLESVKEQLLMFSNLKNQDKLLQYTLTELSQTERVMKRLIKAWKSGDVDAIEKIAMLKEIGKYPEFKSIFEELYFKRNDRMVTKLKKMFNSDQVHFVVVGAAHLVGDRGIISQLKNAGFQTNQY